MLNTWPKLILLAGLVFSAILLLSPQPAEARWPPFDFQIMPVHENGKITYSLKFSKAVEGPLTDVVFKIPLPEGTRFLEAAAQPSPEVQFDGREVTFFTALVHRPLETLIFTVEIIDPSIRLYEDTRDATCLSPVIFTTVESDSEKNHPER